MQGNNTRGCMKAGTLQTPPARLQAGHDAGSGMLLNPTTLPICRQLACACSSVPPQPVRWQGSLGALRTRKWAAESRRL